MLSMQTHNTTQNKQNYYLTKVLVMNTSVNVIFLFMGNRSKVTVGKRRITIFIII